MAQLWEVVGGADKGGILVREGVDLKSPQTADRLSTGALVQEIELAGDRLHFSRLTGTGPETGWVSLALKDKALVVKSDKPAPASSIFDFDVNLSDGSSTKLSEYKSAVTVIVNTASKCGFTNQYEGLQKLHEQFGSEGLKVLAFPCNQFGKQEPGSDEEVQDFCKKTYQVTFPVFAKIDVNFKNSSPLYEYLKSSTDGDKIKWNFTKFLCVGGKPIKRFASDVTPEDMAKDVEEALAGSKTAAYRIRWAVNTDEWEPIGEETGEEFKFLLNLIEPEDERKAVTKFKIWADRKRALLSRLMMRKMSADVLKQTNFKDIIVKRTKGRKPFLESPLPSQTEAPNWNANPSHEGSWVVCASEPHCICGIDVAELRRFKPNGDPIDFHKSFKDQLTQVEWDDVNNAGKSLDDQYECFSRYWAAKEAFSKARGDGMGFTFGKCEFHWKPLQGFPAKTAYEGTVKVEGKLLPMWRLVQHKLPGEKSHWATVARGPLTDIVDAKGEFTKTLRKTQDKFSSTEWRDVLNDDDPVFEVLPLAALVPEDERKAYVKAGGKEYSK